MTEKLTYREAAKRVGRTRRAIRYWRQAGMPMSWDTREGQHVRVVDEDTLLAWWRQRLNNDPAHQYRLRARALQPPRPDDDDPANLLF